jgi:hypothetical protein
MEASLRKALNKERPPTRQGFIIIRLVLKLTYFETAGFWLECTRNLNYDVIGLLLV